MRVQHNILAMNSYRNYTNNVKKLGGNLEKLSSGYKINRAGDDAAGLAISEKMRAQITGLDAAQKNVKDGISFVKTAEGAMQEIQDMLKRMKYLATQSANGTYQNEVDRDNLQKEVVSLRTEIDRIAKSANFNGIYMLNGAAGTGTGDNTTDTDNTAKTFEATFQTADLTAAGLKSASFEGLPESVKSIDIKVEAGTGGAAASAAASFANGKLTITLTKEDGAGAAFANDAAMNTAVNTEIAKIADLKDVKFTGAIENTGLVAGKTASGTVAEKKVEQASGDLAVAAALKPGTPKTNQEMTVGGTFTDVSKASGAVVDLEATDTAITASAWDGKTVTVQLGDSGKTYTATLKDGNLTDGASDEVDISSITESGALLNAVKANLQAQMDADAANGKVGDKAYTELTALALTGGSDGSITATVTTTDYTPDTSTDTDNKTDGTDTDNKTDGTTSGSAIAKDTKVELDLSGVKEIKSGDTFTIGGKVFKIQEKSNTNDPQTPAMAALTGTGTAADPFVVDVNAGFSKDDALTALAAAITEKKDALGVSASYTGGKLTLTAEKEFKSADEFKQAVTVDSSNADVKKAWNDAVEEAVTKLNNGGGDGKGAFKLQLQIGDDAAEYNQMKIQIGGMRTDDMMGKAFTIQYNKDGTVSYLEKGTGGKTISDIDISKQDKASEAIEVIKNAINYVSSVRGDLGATQNRLDHTLNNLSTMAENIQDAESTIRDTDVAEEMMSYVKNNILVQSAQAMLAQANQVPQGVLQLLG